MNPHQLKRLFPNASQSVLQANSYNDTGTTPKLERSSKLQQVVEGKAKKENPKRVFIRIVSIRRRLLDPDNLCEKYHLDMLRYTGIIEDDSPEHITLITSQRKCEKGEEERVIIELSLNDNLKSLTE